MRRSSQVILHHFVKVGATAMLVCAITSAQDTDKQPRPAHQIGSLAQFALEAPTFSRSKKVRESYAYFSANTREHMDFLEAKASLTSFEQANIVAVADRLLCRLVGDGEVDDAIGDFGNEAENSAFLHVASSYESLEYIAALIGRYGH